MSRIAGRFKQLAQQGRKALIPYVVAGDPGLEVTVPLMHRMVACGADIIELGVPFSDPMSEGPVLQLGHERALANEVQRQELAAARALAGANKLKARAAVGSPAVLPIWICSATPHSGCSLMRAIAAGVSSRCSVGSWGK